MRNLWPRAQADVARSAAPLNSACVPRMAQSEGVEFPMLGKPFLLPPFSFFLAPRSFLTVLAFLHEFPETLSWRGKFTISLNQGICRDIEEKPWSVRYFFLFLLEAEVARRVLDAHFPESIRQDVLDAVGLSLEPADAHGGDPASRNRGVRQSGHREMEQGRARVRRQGQLARMSQMAQALGAWRLVIAALRLSALTISRLAIIDSDRACLLYIKMDIISHEAGYLARR
jgi:hypothetical protein